MADVAVYAVHAVKEGGEIGAVEVIMSTEDAARRWAIQRSTDARFWSASVTRYLLDVFGSRQPVAWYVDGKEQDPRASRPYYGTAGPGQ